MRKIYYITRRLTNTLSVMKKYLFFLLLVILTAVVSSCIEDVQLRPQEERDVVLSCILTNKYSQELKLYHSNRLYEDADGDAIDVADVEIELFSHIFGFGKDSSSVGCFVHSGGSIWRLDYTPEPGCSYSIVAKVEGKELYARTLMPDPISRQHVFSSMDVESTFPPRQGRLEFSPKRAPSEQELPNFGCMGLTKKEVFCLKSLQHIHLLILSTKQPNIFRLKITLITR